MWNLRLNRNLDVPLRGIELLNASVQSKLDVQTADVFIKKLLQWNAFIISNEWVNEI